MNMLKKRSQKELLHIAKTTSSLEELFELHLSPNMNIRRAVARNTNISAQLANKLVRDPVLNVSYMANLNPNTTFKREFKSELSGCVICEKDERNIECTNCEFKKRS